MVENAQAIVSSITSTTVFVVTNDVGAFGFVGNVTVSADFSSRFEKVLILVKLEPNTVLQLHSNYQGNL
jgi:hypothetical protein